MRTVEQILREDGAARERAVIETRQTLERVLTDCRKRRRDAQRTASLIVLYGACPTCNTPYIGDDEPCIKCDPSAENEPGGIY